VVVGRAGICSLAACVAGFRSACQTAEVRGTLPLEWSCVGNSGSTAFGMRCRLQLFGVGCSLAKGEGPVRL
jgi:hypothetical protein